MLSANAQLSRGETTLLVQAFAHLGMSDAVAKSVCDHSLLNYIPANSSSINARLAQRVAMSCKEAALQLDVASMANKAIRMVALPIHLCHNALHLLLAAIAVSPGHAAFAQVSAVGHLAVRSYKSNTASITDYAPFPNGDSFVLTHCLLRGTASICFGSCSGFWYSTPVTISAFRFHMVPSRNGTLASETSEATLVEVVAFSCHELHPT